MSAVKPIKKTGILDCDTPKGRECYSASTRVPLSQSANLNCILHEIDYIINDTGCRGFSYVHRGPCTIFYTMSALYEFQEMIREALGGRSATGTATVKGLPRLAIRSILLGHDPKLSRAAEVASALGLEFRIGRKKPWVDLVSKKSPGPDADAIELLMQLVASQTRQADRNTHRFDQLQQLMEQLLEMKRDDPETDERSDPVLPDRKLADGDGTGDQEAAHSVRRTEQQRGGAARNRNLRRDQRPGPDREAGGEG